jgi:hypothetical protein
MSFNSSPADLESMAVLRHSGTLRKSIHGQGVLLLRLKLNAHCSPPSDSGKLRIGVICL